MDPADVDPAAPVVVDMEPGVVTTPGVDPDGVCVVLVCVPLVLGEVVPGLVP